MSLKDEFDQLPAQVRQEFLQFGRTALYQSGDWLPGSADGFDGMRLIEDGEVGVFAVQYAEKIEINRCGRDHFIGVRSMLSPDSLPDIAWCAVGEVTCLEFEKGDVMSLFQREDGFELRQLMERAARERDYDVLMTIHPLFRALPRQERRALLAEADAIALLPDDMLLRQNIENDKLYLISRGKVKVSRDDQLLTYRAAGDIIGEISVLGEGKAATADVSACGWCELLALPGDKIREYSQSFPAFQEKLAEL